MKKGFSSPIWFWLCLHINFQCLGLFSILMADSSTAFAQYDNLETTLEAQNRRWITEVSFPDLNINNTVEINGRSGERKVKVPGVLGTLGKSFSLGPSVYTAFNIDLFFIDKAAPIEQFNYIAGNLQIGLNSNSFKVDNARPQFFLNLTYYRVLYKDTYDFTDNSTDLLTATEFGEKLELGVNFTNIGTGLYSTFKVGKPLQATTQYASENLSADIPSDSTESLDYKKSVYFTLGLGIKF